ncbi:MAG: hypothetical protein KAW41_05765 [Candidatus Diapherotrites archaeon]|nr:hypothetical protein [Candidatus Diapherotrites archaeon]
MPSFKRRRKLSREEAKCVSDTRKQLEAMQVHPKLEGALKKAIRKAKELESRSFTGNKDERLTELTRSYMSLQLLTESEPHLVDLWSGVDEIKLDPSLFALHTEEGPEVGGALIAKRVVKNGKNVLHLSPSVRESMKPEGKESLLSAPTPLAEGEAALFHTHPSGALWLSFHDVLGFRLPYRPHVVVGKGKASLYISKELAALTNLKTVGEDELFGENSMLIGAKNLILRKE